MEKPLPSKSAQVKPNRENELVGGIKNAIERGQPLEKVKQSFINAGYNPSEVNSAAMRLTSHPIQHQTLAGKDAEKKPGFFSRLFGKKQKLETPKSPDINKQTNIIQPTQPIKKLTSGTQSLPSYSNTPQQKNKFSRVWVIVMVIISALILIGAAILGLYWNQIF